MDPQECFPAEHMQAPVFSVVPRYVRGEEHVSAYIEPPHQTQSFHHTESAHHTEQHWEPRPGPDHRDDSHHEQHAEPMPAEQHGMPAPPKHEARAFEAPQAEWDASR